MQKVLIVDDSATIRKMVRASLRGQNQQCGEGRELMDVHGGPHNSSGHQMPEPRNLSYLGAMWNMFVLFSGATLGRKAMTATRRVS